MKLKIKELITIDQQLTGLSMKQFPVAVSFKLRLIGKRMIDHLKAYHEQQKIVLEKFGKLNPKTNKYEFKDDNQNKAQDDIDKLIDVVVDVSIDKISIKDLGVMNIEPSLMNEHIFKE